MSEAQTPKDPTPERDDRVAEDARPMESTGPRVGGQPESSADWAGARSASPHTAEPAASEETTGTDGLRERVVRQLNKIAEELDRQHRFMKELLTGMHVDPGNRIQEEAFRLYRQYDVLPSDLVLSWNLYNLRAIQLLSKELTDCPRCSKEPL